MAKAQRSVEPEIRALVRDLRKELGLTQRQFAELADLPEDTYVARVETGANKLTSHTMRVAFARGFGLSVEDLDAYLEGRLSLTQAVRRSRAVPPATGTG